MACRSRRPVISPSLLENIKFPPSASTKRRIKENFQLGMGEWTDSDDDSEDFRPLKRKPKAVQRESSTGTRFPEPTSEEELAKKSKGVIPKNTQKNDQWALTAFMDWMEQRNKRSLHDQCPKNVLETEDARCLSKWLSLFIIEVRKKDGGKYPPATIHLLLCGLQRIMRRENRQPFDIFDKKDVRFRDFHGTMESVFQSLHSEGIGAEIKHIPLITKEEENKLWEQGILGDSSPQSLVRSVFYMNGKNFCLRGGKEHRELKLSQFIRSKDHWKYIENGSKAFRGGVSDLRRENKVVRQYPCPAAGPGCHVHLLDVGTSAPPAFNFSGCSVNIYTGPVMTSGNFERSNTYNLGLSEGDVDHLEQF